MTRHFITFFALSTTDTDEQPLYYLYLHTSEDESLSESQVQQNISNLCFGSTDIHMHQLYMPVAKVEQFLQEHNSRLTYRAIKQLLEQNTQCKNRILFTSNQHNSQLFSSTNKRTAEGDSDEMDCDYDSSKRPRT